VSQLFLDPASDQDISRYLTQKDIQILKGTGDKLLAEGLDYSFVRFVSDCNQQKLTSAQFKDEIIAEYGVDISNSAHRGANLKNEAVYGALLDIFSFLCE
jgi:hypothetical protein